jgi:hypothetical protein
LGVLYGICLGTGHQYKGSQKLRKQLCCIPSYSPQIWNSKGMQRISGGVRPDRKTFQNLTGATIHSKTAAITHRVLVSAQLRTFDAAGRIFRNSRSEPKNALYSIFANSMNHNIKQNSTPQFQTNQRRKSISKRLYPCSKSTSISHTSNPSPG